MKQQVQKSERQVLVFLHGWAMNSTIWNALRDCLVDRYQVVCIDLPGHGCNAGKFASANFSDWIDELAARAPSAATYIGWSLGGMMALQLAQRYPEKVARLVLIGAVPKFVQSEDWPHGMRATLLDDFIALLDNNIDLAIKQFLMLQVLDSVKYTATLKTLRVAIAANALADKTVLQNGLRFLRDLDLRESARALQCPLLSIYGDKDQLVSYELEQDMHGLHTGMRSVVVEGGGHAPFLSHREKVAAAMTDFIK